MFFSTITTTTAITMNISVMIHHHLHHHYFGHWRPESHFVFLILKRFTEVNLLNSDNTISRDGKCRWLCNTQGLEYFCPNAAKYLGEQHFHGEILKPLWLSKCDFCWQLKECRMKGG